jgi:hypothetical protein
MNLAVYAKAKVRERRIVRDREGGGLLVTRPVNCAPQSPVSAMIDMHHHDLGRLEGRGVDKPLLLPPAEGTFVRSVVGAGRGGGTGGRGGCWASHAALPRATPRIHAARSGDHRSRAAVCRRREWGWSFAAVGLGHRACISHSGGFEYFDQAVIDDP